MPTTPEIGIKTLNPGDSFVGFCVLRKKEMRTTQKGEPYLFLELSDWSGRLRAKLWQNASREFGNLHVGQILKIKAVIQTFNNIKELKILKFRPATEKDDVPLEQLLPGTKRDVTQLVSIFRKHVESVQNPFLQQLLNQFLEDPRWTEKYFKCPAGKLWHHNYLFGLLEHVVSLLDLSETLSIHYPQLNLDILKTAIILHDIGKLETYSLNGFIDKTDKGKLLGHVFISYEMVLNQIARIDNFPENLKTELLHIICSHQTEEQNEAYVMPMTLEAVVMSLLNALDSTTNAVVRIMDKDILPSERWSKFIPLLNRFIYVGQKSNQQQNNHNKT